MSLPLPDRRAAWPLLIAMAVLLPVVGWGVKRSFDTANNNIAQWLPEGYPETEDYASFQRLFGTDEFALITWPNCTVGPDVHNEQLARLAQRINHPSDEGPNSPTRWFSQATTGPQLLRRLMDEPLNLSFREAAERLDGTLIGQPPEASQGENASQQYLTAALVTFSEAGNDNRTAAVQALRQLATETTGLGEEDLHLAGGAVTNAAIDIESERSVQRWLLTSWLIALGVAWACLRRLRLVVMVFLVAGYSSLLGSAMVYYTGATMNLVLVIVPVLVYVLSLSASVHLVNYYRDAVREQGSGGATGRALRAGWLPIVLAATTTSLGLISLVVSHLVPVQLFGIFAALGTMTGTALLLLVLPAMLDRWPLRWKNERATDAPPAADSSPAPAAATGVSPVPPNSGNIQPANAPRPTRLLRGIAGQVVRHRYVVIVVGLLAFGVLAYGVTLIRTSVAPGRFFARDSEWVQDAVWIQQHIGPIVPLEVMLEFPRQTERQGEAASAPPADPKRDQPSDSAPADADPYTLSPLQRLELTRIVAQLITRHERTGGTLSAATFLPRPPTRADGSVARTVFNTRLADQIPRLERTDFVRRTPEAEFWRISGRLPGFRNVDHDLVLDELRGELDRYMERAGLDRQLVRPTITGIVPLVFVAQRELLHGLINSFLLAFALIGVVMLVLLRHPITTLAVMLPNVFPAVAVFGFMGWTGTLVDVGAMMTASVAMGIAVDDTLHFLTWFRRSRAAGRSTQAAAVDAFQRCAVAMGQTTLIAGLGLIVFAWSDFLPVAQFGLLMFILLLAALAGDLILLPAILTTRIGRGTGKLSRTGRR